MSLDLAGGCCRSAPRLPHFTQRTLARNRSLDVPAPQRMITGVMAIGARCIHFTFRQSTHNRGADWRISSRVGGVTRAAFIGVAGGEFIIPILIFLFGIEIKTNGTASVLISVPIVVTGVVRHWLTGHYRSQSMLLYLVLPMSVGSLLGAAAGSYLAVSAPTDTLRLTLAVFL
jgi:hypothetical protein